MASHHRRLSTPGFPSISALTAVLETQHMKSINHRFFYAAKISPERTNYKDFADHCEKLFKKLLTSHLGESITGLLLIYPTCVIHIIESSSEILYGIIQDLAHIQVGVNSLLQEARILVISHNISSKLFQQWYCHRMKLQSNYPRDDTQNQSEEVVAERCLTALLKLGIFLSEFLQPGSKGPGEDLSGLAPELCVQEETIHFLLKSDRFLKAEEFLAMYDRPVNVSILSDQLWPASQHFDL
ncbi:testis-expressed protein 47-like [Rana temporaria]|uniref:testis-expressed protein 47-like n=1 Tax=Rana temporaria TaxID=8407 RepID=UPI001AADC04A|nr:testis-expressed protein 47-like [Rana temporaria]